MPHRHVVRGFVLATVAATALGTTLAAAGTAVAAANGQPGPPVNTHGGPDGRTLVTSFDDVDHHTGEVTHVTIVNEYSTQGRLVRSSETDTSNGVETYSSVTALDYGQANRLARTVQVLDLDGAGPEAPATIVGSYAYDGRGDLVSLTTTVDEGSDGTIDSTRTDDSTFDRRGRIAQERIEVNGHVLVFDVTLDAQGNLVDLVTTDDDLSTPQSPDTRTESATTYGPHHRQLATSDKTYAVDAQGVEHLVDSSSATFTYNARGDLVGLRSVTDTDGDGTVDDVRTVENTVDSQGRILATVSTDVSGGSTFVGRITHTLDQQGNVVLTTAEDRTDGVLTASFVEHDTYDQKGRLTGFVDETDLDGDGVVDQVESVSIAYDQLNRVVRDTARVTDGAGTLLSTRVRTLVYGQDTETVTIQLDDDGDGTVDRTEVGVFPL